MVEVFYVPNQGSNTKYVPYTNDPLSLNKQD